MRRSGFVALVICSLLTLASATGLSVPTDAHDIYMALKNRFGQSCCNEGDCRPAHYRTTANGIQMLVDGEWLAVPDDAIQYRALEGDTGETRGGHWCGLMTFGNHTYCAILPPTFGRRLGGVVGKRAIRASSDTVSVTSRVAGAAKSNKIGR
jgi:hypothetical protein